MELKIVEGLLGEVFYPLWFDNVINYNPNMIRKDNTIISIGQIQNLINNSFMWYETPQGAHFWLELHNLLIEGKPLNITPLQITEAFDKLLGRTPLWQVYHLGKYIGTTSGNSIEELSAPSINGYYNDDIDFFMADLNDFEIDNFSFKPSVSRYQTWSNVFDVFTHMRKTDLLSHLDRNLSTVISLGTHLYSVLMYTEIEQD